MSRKPFRHKLYPLSITYFSMFIKFSFDFCLFRILSLKIFNVSVFALVKTIWPCYIQLPALWKQWNWKLCLPVLIRMQDVCYIGPTFKLIWPSTFHCLCKIFKNMLISFVICTLSSLNSCKWSKGSWGITRFKLPTWDGNNYCEMKWEYNAAIVVVRFRCKIICARLCNGKMCKIYAN